MGTARLPRTPQLSPNPTWDLLLCADGAELEDFCSRLRGCFNPAQIQAGLKFLFFHPAPCCGHGVSRGSAGHTRPSWVWVKPAGTTRSLLVGRAGFPRQNPCCSPFPCPLLALPRLSLLQAVPLTLLGGEKQRERAPGWAQKRAASESAPPAARQRGEILLSEADRGFTRLHYGTRASNKSSEAHKRTQANAESAPHAPGASPGSVCFRWLQGASGGRGGQSQVRSRTQHAWMAQGISP